MARMQQELLDVDLRVGEGAARLFARQRQRIEQGRLLLHHAHAAAPAAARRLDDHRVADLACYSPHGCRLLGQRAVRPGHAGHAGRAHRAFGGDLVAHRADALGARADEGQAGALDLVDEAGVLGEEPVAGVDGLRAADLGRREQRSLIQVAQAR